MAKKSVPVFIRDATGLTRSLSSYDVIMYNLLNMGLAWPLLYGFFAAGAYPGVNLPIAVLVALPPNLIIALLFYYLSVAFPRTGGDYVWVSRLVHPAIGFMESFAIVVFFLGFVGPVSGFAMTYGFSTMFTNLAIATGNTGYMALASAVASQNSILIGSLLTLVAIVLGAAFGLKNTFRFQWTFFIIMIAGLAVFLVAALGTPLDVFKSNFNQLSGANYDTLLNAAKSSNMVIDFTVGATVIGSFYAFLNYIGYALSVYVGGEVKQAQKSQFIGIIGSTVVFAVLCFALYGAPYPGMGGNFISALSQLSATGNSAYTLPSQPVPSFLVIFSNPSVFVAVLVPLAIIASVVGSLETIVLMAVRVVFAWSFDRVTPTKLAEVTDKRGSPNYALALIAVVSLVYIMLSVYAANFLTFSAYSTSGIFLSIAFVGVAGILLPYKHKDLFEAAPANVKRRLGGVPVIAILGVATLLTGLFVAYIAASPIFTGAAVNPLYLAGLAGVFISGLVIYEISAYYHKSKGIDLSLTFNQIPPE